jgi:cytochrome c
MTRLALILRPSTFLSLSAAALLGACGEAGPKVDQDAVARGQKLFATCSACHTVSSDHMVGPGLGGVVGRAAGQAPGFGYSDALKAAKFDWTEERLIAFLSTEDYLPGTNMVITPLSPEEARDVVAYLATTKG